MLAHRSFNRGAFMAGPTLIISNGPGQRDLEQAFLARKLGATARFSVICEGSQIVEVSLQILNFAFVTCHGPKYQLGGQLAHLSAADKEKLPAYFNFIFVEYDTEKRQGGMEFSNGG
jgi:hypothetical protein